MGKKDSKSWVKSSLEGRQRSNSYNDRKKGKKRLRQIGSYLRKQGNSENERGIGKMRAMGGRKGTPKPGAKFRE